MAGINVSFDAVRNKKVGVQIDPEKLYFLYEVISQDLLCKQSYYHFENHKDEWNETVGKRVRMIRLTIEDLKEMGLYDDVKIRVDRMHKLFRATGGGRFPDAFIKGEDMLRYLYNNLDERVIAELRARRRFKDLFYAQTGAINY